MKLKELREFIVDLDDNIEVINGESGRFPVDSIVLTYDGKKLIIY